MLTPNSCPYCNSSNQANANICVTCGSSLINIILETRDPISALPANTELGQGQFRILNEIARGGFGITYLAFHIVAKTYVAVKECFPNGIVTRDSLNVIANHGLNLEFQNTLEHFNREAEILNKLEHPSATEILAHLAENNTAYIVMEYAKGETLEHRIQRKKLLSSNEAIAILEPLLELLAEVHDLGVLHRDIKPANIILTSERPELIDFGSVIEYNIGKSSKVTSRLLTPAYAPLEQYGQTVTLTPATDLYALGATFYEAITGVTPPDAISRLNGQKLKPIEQLEPRIKPNLANIINRTLEMKLEDRFLSARHILQTLKDDFRYSNQSGVSRLNTRSNSAYSSFPKMPPATMTPAQHAQALIQTPNPLLPKHYPMHAENPEYEMLTFPRFLVIFLSFLVAVGISLLTHRFGFYGFPIAFLYFWLENMWLASRSEKFLAINGVVVINDTYNQSRQTIYWLEYVYTIAGVVYRANRNSFTAPSANYLLVSNYPANSTIPIFYDPDYPGQAVINRGLTWDGFGTIIVRGMMFLVSIVLAFTDFTTPK
jgi:serine/threonine protein kinase